MVSNLQFIRNYISLHDEMDNEEKMITHIIAGTDYIIDNWAVADIKV